MPGFWLLERCASEWGDTTARELLDLPGAGDQVGSVFDVREDRFLAPEHMADEVRDAAGLAADASRAAVVSSIVRSIAAGVASVVGELRSIQPLRELAIVGGGAASPVVRQAVEEAAGVRLVAGPPEATALGNALLQGLSLGRFSTLADARVWAAARATDLTRIAVTAYRIVIVKVCGGAGVAAAVRGAAVVDHLHRDGRAPECEQGRRIGEHPVGEDGRLGGEEPGVVVGDDETDVLRGFVRRPGRDPGRPAWDGLCPEERDSGLVRAGAEARGVVDGGDRDRERARGARVAARRSRCRRRRQR